MSDASQNPHPVGTREHFYWEKTRHDSTVFGSRFDLWNSQERVNDALSAWSRVSRARFNALLARSQSNSR